MKNILKGIFAALLSVIVMAACKGAGDGALAGSHVSFISGNYELIIGLQDSPGGEINIGVGSEYSLYDGSARISYGTLSAVSGNNYTFTPAAGAENNFTANVNLASGTVSAFTAKKNNGTPVSIPAMVWGPAGTWKAAISGIGVCLLTVTGNPASGTWTLSIVGYGEYDRGIYTYEGSSYAGYSTLINKTTAGITFEGTRKMQLVLNDNSYAPGSYTLYPINTKLSLGINRHRKF